MGDACTAPKANAIASSLQAVATVRQAFQDNKPGPQQGCRALCSPSTLPHQCRCLLHPRTGAASTLTRLRAPTREQQENEKSLRLPSSAWTSSPTARCWFLDAVRTRLCATSPGRRPELGWTRSNAKTHITLARIAALMQILSPRGPPVACVWTSRSSTYPASPMPRATRLALARLRPCSRLRTRFVLATPSLLLCRSAANAITRTSSSRGLRGIPGRRCHAMPPTPSSV